MTLTIGRLGHLGDGIAEGPVFVRRALPGEVVDGEIEGGRIERPKILTPSPERVTPPCPHYAACGGCELMHARDSFVSDWKADVVRAALTAQGIDAPVRGVHVSPPAARRRAVFSGRRTKSGVIAGFHGRASGTITEVPECRVVRPALIAALPVVREIVALGGSRKGEVRVSVTETAGGLDVAAEGMKPLDEAARMGAAALAERHDLARFAWNGDVLFMRRPPILKLGNAWVAPPSGSFLQATAEGEAALLAGVREVLVGTKRAVDLFSGSGTFALPLAAEMEVHAVEAEAEMLAALDRGWREAPGLKRVTTQARDLFRRPLLVDELAGFDGAVIDPPRAGAERQAAELARSGIARIAHVSCNPVTFARDARVLCDGGFRLDWIDVVDQFRWSPHVELIGAFMREK